MKFYNKEFVVDKKYYNKILDRTDSLVGAISKNAAVHSTLVTTTGLKKNEYSGAFVKVITLDDLFSS